MVPFLLIVYTAITSTKMDNLIKFETDLSHAIKQDLDKLILTYEKEQSLLFDKFAEIWRNLTVSLIYG